MFFFQAEDGIRDLIVTGVQTCALPILRRPSFSRLAVSRTASSEVAAGTMALAPLARAGMTVVAARNTSMTTTPPPASPGGLRPVGGNRTAIFLSGLWGAAARRPGTSGGPWPPP